MSTSWIKYDTSLHDKPRVQWIADHLKIDRYSVAGRLCAVWAWADTMTECGRIPFGTLAQVDRVAEMDGFGEAMRAVGWLETDGTDLVIPQWDKHHSASAKKRAQTNKRVANHRQKPSNEAKKRERNAESVTDCNPKSVTRGDKRRGEEIVVADATTTASSCENPEATSPEPQTPDAEPTAADLLEPFGYAAAAAEAVERAIGVGAVVDIVESCAAITANEPGKIKNPNGWVRSMVAAAREGRFEIDPRVVQRRRAQRTTEQVGADRERMLATAAEREQRTKAEADRVASLIDGLTDAQWRGKVERVLEDTKGTFEGDLLRKATEQGQARQHKSMRLRVAEIVERETEAVA